jgi:3-oxoacyl-[acyl-carrier protein] reductase
LFGTGDSPRDLVGALFSVEVYLLCAVHTASTFGLAALWERVAFALGGRSRMDLQLSDKIALVTGASMGIGHAIARGLAAEGVHVCITARRRGLLEELADRISSSGHKRPAVIDLDITEDGAPTRLAKAAVSALGRVDILVNSAGGSVGPTPIDGSEEKWEQAMRLNFIRVRQLTHELLPVMIAHRHGRIINISGKSEVVRLVAAASAKAAVHAWSKGLSREVGRHGITVNCIAPGRIMSEQIRRKYSEEFRARQSAEEIAVGRYGEPEELAALAVFLASPLASYITGAVLPVDGGLRRYAF